MDPVVRTEILILRDIATIAKNKYYPGNRYYHGMLGVIDQGYDEQMTLHLHVLPYTKGHYNMGKEYYLWSYLFDSPNGQEPCRSGLAAHGASVLRLWRISCTSRSGATRN